MKIIELVRYLKNVQEAEKFIDIEFPDLEYDLVDIYMINKIDPHSDIVFFDAEKIPNKLIIDIEGVTYENLFPLNMAQDMVEELVNNNKKVSDLEIADFLLSYRKKDT